MTFSKVCLPSWAAKVNQNSCIHRLLSTGRNIFVNFFLQTAAVEQDLVGHWAAQDGKENECKWACCLQIKFQA